MGNGSMRDNTQTPPLQKCALRAIVFEQCEQAWQGSMTVPHLLIRLESQEASRSQTGVMEPPTDSIGVVPF